MLPQGLAQKPPPVSADMGLKDMERETILGTLRRWAVLGAKRRGAGLE